MTYTKSGSSISIYLELSKLGDAYTAILSGGESPHIGCVVLAEPRPSLADPAVISCTSSVINRTGHKDEAVCRPVAEALCIHFNAPVVCTGGVHVDAISPEQIAGVSALVDEIIHEIVSAH